MFFFIKEVKLDTLVPVHQTDKGGLVTCYNVHLSCPLLDWMLPGSPGTCAMCLGVLSM